MTCYNNILAEMEVKIMVFWLALVFKTLAQNEAAAQKQQAKLFDMFPFVADIVMVNRQAYVNWTSVMDGNSTKQFNYFNGDSGDGIIAFKFVLTNPNQSPIPHVNLISIELQDPFYVDGKVCFVHIPVVKGFNAQTKSWSGNSQCFYELYGNRKKLSGTPVERNCTYNISVLKFQVNSADFAFSGEISEPLRHSWLPYVMIVPNLVLLACLWKVKHGSDVNGKKISMLTLGLALNMLLFVSISELYLGLLSAGSPEFWLILTSSISFACAVQFTYTFLPVIAQMTAYQYCQFYLLTFGYIWCVFRFGTEWVFLLANSLVLLPQILHNEFAVMGVVFNPYILLSMVLPQIYPLYLKGYPRNIMRWQPEPWLCFSIILLLALQILLIFCQSRKIRILIPRFFIPKNFNRIEREIADAGTEAAIEECSICLLSLTHDPEQAEESTTSQSLSTLEVQIVKTPCNHRFHVSCLTSWMEHKLECPVDRQPLLPIIV